MLSYTNTWPISILRYQTWYSELEPSATRKSSQENNQSDRQFHHALYPPCREDTPKEELTSVAFLPFVGPTFNCISRMLTRHNIKTVGVLPRKVTSFLLPIKDDLGLKTAAVYSIPCKRGKVYIGQTWCSTETRIKEHHRHIRLSS
jgi:hypothetical protein